MYLDALEMPDGHLLECEVCVVGSGAAGITAARELMLAGHSVVLLEGGAEKPTASDVDLYKGTSLSRMHGELHLYRQRRLGGTTVVWGGRAAPYESIDLQKRPFVSNSGWPLTIEELEQAYIVAQEYLDLGQFSYSASQSFTGPNQIESPGLEASEITVDKIWRFSLPTDSWKKYRKELVESTSLRVVVHANCTEILLAADGYSVSSLIAKSIPSKTIRVKAKRYVLAMGGLEVTRILMASNQVSRNGIGNHGDMLGRFYMSHVTGNAGMLHFKEDYARSFWTYPRDKTGVYCQRIIALKDEVQRREGVQNLAVTARHLDIHNADHRSAVLSSAYLAKRYFLGRIPPEFNRELSMSPYEHLGDHARNVLRQPLALARFAATWLRKRILATRKLPSVSIHNPSNSYTLHFDAEQSPNPNSRITLSNEGDALGVPRLQADWKLSAVDIESVCRSLTLIRDGLKTSGIAEAELRPDLEEAISAEISVGSHHIGTTRMGRTSAEGVVDKDCRVFGVDNLFIASSSTFPTSSYVNPTFQIVALAVRIAATIHAELAK